MDWLMMWKIGILSVASFCLLVVVCVFGVFMYMEFKDWQVHRPKS